MNTPKETVEAALPALIKEAEDSLACHIAQMRRMLDWLKANATAIQATGIVPSICGYYIDFDRPKRQQVLAIIRAFPGKWNKEQCVSEGAMNYLREAADGEVALRIWGGALPPSCRLISETVVVPEHTETKTRIVCSGVKSEANP